jgi:hypothetical protein
MWERLDALRAQVRDALTRAEQAALQAQSNEPADEIALRAAVRELVEISRAELSIEDGEMIPILTLADGWGPIRAFYMRADLASERAALAAVGEDAASKPLDEVADEVLWLVKSLRRSLRVGDEVIAAHRVP